MIGDLRRLRKCFTGQGDPCTRCHHDLFWCHHFSQTASSCLPKTTDFVSFPPPPRLRTPLQLPASPLVWIYDTSLSSPHQSRAVEPNGMHLGWHPFTWRPPSDSSTTLQLTAAIDEWSAHSAVFSLDESCCCSSPMSCESPCTEWSVFKIATQQKMVLTSSVGLNWICWRRSWTLCLRPSWFFFLCCALILNMQAKP